MNKRLTWAYVGLACLLLAPNLVHGVRESHDIKFHLMLFLSWRDAVELGTLYPRWLPDQLHGLGSPALLIYPPMASAFFVLIDFLTLHALAPGRVLGLGALLLSIASAVTFYPWARQHISPRLALIVALFYATAPYHLNLDLYERGAMAEYTAFVWIPLIFLGIRTTLQKGGVRGAALLAIGISALFLSHLLTAMLIAPLAFAYALICLCKELPANLRIQRFVLVTVTTILSVGLTAFYLLPAMLLLPEANSGGLARDVATTNIWLVLQTLSDRFWIKLLLLACAYLVFFLYLSAQTWRNWRQQRVLGAATTLALMWIVSGILCFALMSGFFPFIFHRPSPFAQIQFVFRLLTVMEFSLISLFVCCVAGAQQEDSRACLLKMGAIVLLLMSAAQWVDIAGRFHNMPIVAPPFQNNEQVKWRLSPIEYFPAGTKLGKSVQETFKPFEQYAIANQPAFIVSDKGKLVEASRKGARFMVHSITTEPTLVMIQQFYFPGWKAVDEHGREITVFRDVTSRLTSYVAPAGEQTIVIERVPTKQEHWGNIISLVALALLIIQFSFLIRRRAVRYPT
ncbi:hypothetical protein [Massilia sp. TN1-12]|uniref:hypothetical protein n=1 Tax=Massilia paldalensis TaxID=3377675 RepID=UPI00384E4159